MTKGFKKGRKFIPTEKRNRGFKKDVVEALLSSNNATVEKRNLGTIKVDVQKLKDKKSFLKKFEVKEFTVGVNPLPKAEVTFGRKSE